MEAMLIQLKEPVEAIQYTGDNADAVIELIGQYNVINGNGTMHLVRGGQYLTVDIDDYVINMRGNILVATPRFFANNYVEVSGKVPEPIQPSTEDTGLREVLPRPESATAATEDKTPS